MEKFIIPVSWTMTSLVTVEANTPAEALSRANDVLYKSNVGLPKTNAYYLDESFQIDAESEDDIETADRFTNASVSEIIIHADGSVTT